MPPRVLVLGGYGAFGAHAAERLARSGGVELIIAGRSPDKARAFAEALTARHEVPATSATIDATGVTVHDLAPLRPAIVLNASGPYQAQDYAVARAAIAAGAHYIDLADARDFAVGIAALDAEARRAHVLVASGASSVPAVSAAVVDAYAPTFAAIRAITTVISPGNRFDPGLATTRSILGSIGKPFPALREGQPAQAHGWQGLQRQRMPGLGRRWIGDCDAPDLAIFPQRYPGLASVRVCAALEIDAFHLGLWMLSGLVRAGLMRHPQMLAAPLLALKQRLHALGSDRGGMTVTLEGTGTDGAPRRLLWSLVASKNHGPVVPATPAVIIARKLLHGSLAQRGAMPAVGLFTLAEFRAAVCDLCIRDEVEA